MKKDSSTSHTRRAVLAGTAGLGAAFASGAHLTQPAAAAAPAIGKQAPGYYRYKVGDIELTQVTDGARSFPLSDTFVRNAKKEDVQAALEAAFMPKETLTIVFNPLVANTGGKLVVIDTGNGPQPQPNATVGQFATNLTAAGVDPANVDIVVISHFHGDHINGLRAAGGGLAFPNAEVKVPAAEWAFWMSDENMNKAPEGLKANFQNVRRVFGSIADKVTRYDADKEVVPGITAIATPGHTPGHVSYVVASGKDKLLISSDVTNMPYLFARHPGWHVMFDMDGAQAEATRRKFFDMAASERMRIAGFHYPFPALGHAEKDGTGYRYVPAPWNPVI